MDILNDPMSLAWWGKSNVKTTVKEGGKNLNTSGYDIIQGKICENPRIHDDIGGDPIDHIVIRCRNCGYCKGSNGTER
ncbi:MAG: hypothetical protein LBK26_04710 [Rickettsiales bacterium]|jgi:hypothetical protein|nr:hypothetical protein [Rickettsiales bacterium]